MIAAGTAVVAWQPVPHWRAIAQAPLPLLLLLLPSLASAVADLFVVVPAR